MRMIPILVCSSALFASGCQNRPSNETKEQADRWVENFSAGAQIGRFQFHSANGEMPALVFDSATGCIELIEKFTLDDKPKEVVWIRKVADEVVKGTPNRCAEEKPTQVIQYDAKGNRLPGTGGAESTSRAAEEK
jgi:hypothetical protein